MIFFLFFFFLRMRILSAKKKEEKESILPLLLGFLNPICVRNKYRRLEVRTRLMRLESWSSAFLLTFLLFIYIYIYFIIDVAVFEGGNEGSKSLGIRGFGIRKTMGERGSNFHEDLYIYKYVYGLSFSLILYLSFLNSFFFHHKIMGKKFSVRIILIHLNHLLIDEIIDR